MNETALFDATPYLAPQADATGDNLSADRKRTVRQSLDLAKGVHPLTGSRLHPQAAPHNNRDAVGLRCGTCRFRVLSEHHNRTYAKCRWPDPSEWRDRLLPRVSHGAATDVRAWWPACTDYEAVP